jgi:hypothetical protein
MRLARGCVLVLCSAAALLIAASSPALAAGEGPFFKVAGARLALSASQVIETSAAKTFVLAGGTFTIECTKIKNAAADAFKGSNGKNGSTSEEHLTFEGCTQTGFGPPPCALVGNKFETNALKNMLGFTNAVSVKSELLPVFFQPIAGTQIALIKFEPIGTCTVPEVSLEGSFAGEPSNKGKAVKFEEEPAEEESNEVNFPSPALKALWLEEGGTRKEIKPALRWFGVAAKLTGTSSVKLKSKQKWGVFAK